MHISARARVPTNIAVHAEEAFPLERDQARKLISGILDEAVDDVDTERLESMKCQVEVRMKAARSKGLYRKVIDALDTEIQARERPERVPHMSPHTPSETRAGSQEDEPGDLRHRVPRQAGKKSRATGR